MKQRPTLYYHVRTMVYRADEKGDQHGEFMTLFDPDVVRETPEGITPEPVQFESERDAQIVAFNISQVRQTYTQVQAIRSDRAGSLTGECIHEYSHKMSEADIAAIGFDVLGTDVPEADAHLIQEPLKLPGLH